MADQKISALTSATTPLAGTEVLPIVQSGSTVKVAVSDLTAGRDVSATGVTVTGATPRISGVMSGSPVTARTAFVNSVVNSDSFLNLLPNGTGTSSGFQAYNNSDPTNSAYGTISASSSVVAVNSTTRGSGTFLPLTFNTSNVEQVRISTAGEVTVNTGNLVINTATRGITLPGGITWTSGAGSPEGVVTAPVGSLYSRSNGGALTSLYVKESGSGNTGWVGK
jgi:hypothetical protein